MNRRSDALGVLMWGLRTYAWVVVLFTVALGIVVPLALAQAPPTYEASAQAGPTGRVQISNLDALPKVGSSVFANVYESEEVLAAADLNAEGQLAPGEVELVAGQDNLIFTVVARSNTAEGARRLADTAVTEFVDEFNKYSQAIGSYGVSTLAETPSEPVARTGVVASWGLGLLAGLLLGIGTVALIMLVKRPVIDTPGAEAAAGAPVFARVTLHGRRKLASPGMAPLCRRILAEPTRLVMLVGPHNTLQHRYALTEELVRWLGRVRRVVPLRRRAEVEEFGTASVAAARDATVGADRSDLLVLDDASPVEVATRPDETLTLLVVREGISQRSLSEYADQYLDGDDTAIVLVAKRSRLGRSAGPFRHRAGSRRSDANRTTSEAGVRPGRDGGGTPGGSS